MRWIGISAIAVAACSREARQPKPPATGQAASAALGNSINLFTVRARANTRIYLEPAGTDAPCATTSVRRVQADTMLTLMLRKTLNKSVETMWDPRAVDDTTDHWVYGVWRIAASSPPDAIKVMRDGKLLMVWAMRVSADTIPHLHGFAVRDFGQGNSLNTWSEFSAADSTCAGPAIRPRAALDTLLAGHLIQP